MHFFLLVSHIRGKLSALWNLRSGAVLSAYCFIDIFIKSPRTKVPWSWYVAVCIPNFGTTRNRMVSFAHCRLTLKDRTRDTYWIGACVSSRTGLELLKSTRYFPCLEFDKVSVAVQPVAKSTTRNKLPRLEEKTKTESYQNTLILVSELYAVLLCEFFFKCVLKKSGALSNHRLHHDFHTSLLLHHTLITLNRHLASTPFL